MKWIISWWNECVGRSTNTYGMVNHSGAMVFDIIAGITEDERPKRFIPYCINRIIFSVNGTHTHTSIETMLRRNIQTNWIEAQQIGSRSRHWTLIHSFILSFFLYLFSRPDLPAPTYTHRHNSIPFFHHQPNLKML